jgi:hypothetical protein
VTLSPNFNEDEDDDLLFKPKSVNISTNAKTKQFLSIHQWTVHYLQLPSQTPSLCLPYEKLHHKTLSYENQIASTLL